jgi:glycerol uptake facilitator-like aquaporin
MLRGMTAVGQRSHLRAIVAEATGTMFLLATVVGSGIMGERLSGGNVAIALLANSLATGAALVALILAFSPLSGAHFNPAVTLVEALQSRLPAARAFSYVVAQMLGACAGVIVAHLMFTEPVVTASTHERSGAAQIFSEFIATFGLVTVIAGVSRTRSSAVSVAVGAYIVAAYWFTSSTSFANPAVTVARAFTDTFAGIRPVDVPGFLAGQLGGAAASIGLYRWLSGGAPHTEAEFESRSLSPGS